MSIKCFRNTVAGLSMLSLAGCSLVDPVVLSDKLFPTNTSANTTNVYAGDIEDALRIIEDQQRKYLDAAGLRSTVRGSIAPITGGLTIGGLFYHLFGSGSSDVLAGLALGGASVLTAGTFYENRPLERLYYESARVLECVKRSARPLKLTIETFGNMSVANIQLLNLIGDVEADIQTLKSSDKADDARVKSFIATAETMVAEATDIHDKIGQYRLAIKHGKGDLLQRARELVLEINPEIVKTIPTPSEVRGFLKNYLAQAANLPSLTLPPADKFVKSGRSLEVFAEEPVSSPFVLQIAKLKEMRTEAGKLRIYLVDAENSRKVVANSEACKAPKAALSLTIRPDVEELNVTAGREYPFIVSSTGGLPIGLVSPKLTGDKAFLQDENFRTRTFTLKIDDAAAVGDEYIFSIWDDRTPENTRDIKLKVTKAKPATTNKETTGTSGKACTNPLGRVEGDDLNFTKDKVGNFKPIVELIQAYIGAEIDGQFCDQSRDSLVAFGKANTSFGISGRALPSKIREALISAAEDKMAADNKDPNDDEKALIADPVKWAIVIGKLAALKPALDADDRKLIINYQKANALEITSRLDEPTLKKLGVIAPPAVIPPAPPEPEISLKDAKKLVVVPGSYEAEIEKEPEALAGFHKLLHAKLTSTTLANGSVKFDAALRETIWKAQEKAGVAKTGRLTSEAAMNDLLK